MKLNFKFAAILLLTAFVAISCSKKDYETVKNDPLKARIYTLDNGLKVYMTVNKEQPRIQTYIAVRVGSKNDPAETTGLAHYFEHLMFKGSQKFGTQNYETEKPMLDEIERLFEVYRQTTDVAERNAIYKIIDSVSLEASKLAIPNEYDKLMSAIGASGTNAYTSYDLTCYVEDIPSNQVENWAKIQIDRFENNVIRGFHTELETVYEEYNMSLTDDSEKAWDAMFNGLYPNHPYGTQTTLGTQEHLKNPSITNIKNFYKQYYVPNNMAICLSGDFDPDATIEIIKKYFGGMKANDELPEWKFTAETPISTPVVKEVVGLEAENIWLAWRIGGKASGDDTDIAKIAGRILYNQQAGLMDLNINQQQKALICYGYAYSLADYGVLMLQGRPKMEQTLDEVKDLMLAEIAKLRAGDFDEALLKATVANYKLQITQYLDSNRGRANAFVESFVNGTKWEDEIKQLERLSKITKDDVVKFANEKFTDNNFVVIYKRQGTPEDKKIEKPTITPIATNRDAKSDFLAEIQDSKVEEIEPVFVDFNTDMEKTTAKSNIPVLYKKNETTELFDLNYVFEIGSTDDATLNTAFDYIDYLGTSTKTPEQIKQEFYNIACSFDTYVQANRCYVSVSGLSENMPRAMELMEELLADAQPNESVLENVKSDILKGRIDAKANQERNFGALRQFMTYGSDYIKAITPSNNVINGLKSEDLIAKVKDLMTKEHSVLYYGPLSSKELVDAINKYHKTPETLSPITDKAKYPALLTPEAKVYLAQYDAKQIYYIQHSNRGEKFNIANDADHTLFNEYFGGGMGSIVFQEMREARGLAYSAQAWLNTPRYAGEDYTFLAFIATQNDKMTAAIDAFAEIIENMPESEAAFNIAKESLLARLRTERTIKSDVLWAYLNAQDKGVNIDREKAIFEKAQSMTLADVKAIQEKWIKGRTYVYGILGDIKDLDMKKLNSLGKIERLSQEQIFGY